MAPVRLSSGHVGKILCRMTEAPFKSCLTTSSEIKPVYQRTYLALKVALSLKHLADTCALRRQYRAHIQLVVSRALGAFGQNVCSYDVVRGGR